jgi:beta-lactamase class A
MARQAKSQMIPFARSRRSLLWILPVLALQRPLDALDLQSGTEDGQFAAIEKGIGGRLGVAALDTGTGRRLGYRTSELFAMCSTFKLLLAGCILRRVDAGTEDLKRLISYGQKDLLDYAPVTRAHLQQGAMTVGDLCAAAIEVSDNTAANLLLAQIGGAAGLTKFIRTLGDQVTRLDRIEPDLNSALPGDERDTTSPAAMVDSMEKLLVGNALSPATRAQLASWLEQSTTGKNRLRAGFPADWRAGDKTGTGARGAIGDVGIFWPPDKSIKLDKLSKSRKAPILVAAYIMEENVAADEREQAIAEVGRIIAHEL